MVKHNTKMTTTTTNMPASLVRYSFHRHHRSVARWLEVSLSGKFFPNGTTHNLTTRRQEGKLSRELLGLFVCVCQLVFTSRMIDWAGFNVPLNTL